MRCVTKIVISDGGINSILKDKASFESGLDYNIIKGKILGTPPKVRDHICEKTGRNGDHMSPF